MQGMMRTVCLIMMLCVAWALVAPNITVAQDEPIKVKLEIDGKEIHQPFKILLSVEGSAIFEPPITKSGFIFPLELRSYEKVNLRLLYKEYDLDYGDLPAKFKGELIFGVDTKPFTEEHLSDNPDANKELMLIYYIDSGQMTQTTYIYK
jgi:hypothetical protein